MSTSFFSACQPVVKLVEDALQNVAKSWKEQSDSLNGKLDDLIELQRERLQLEGKKKDLDDKIASVMKAIDNFLEKDWKGM